MFVIALMFSVPIAYLIGVILGDMSATKICAAESIKKDPDKWWHVERLKARQRQEVREI